MHRTEALARLKQRQDDPDVNDLSSYRNIVIAKSYTCLSQMIFDSAFCELYKGYYFVFPEHHEPQIFHKDEYNVVEVERV